MTYLGYLSYPLSLLLSDLLQQGNSPSHTTHATPYLNILYTILGCILSHHFQVGVRKYTHRLVHLAILFIAYCWIWILMLYYFLIAFDLPLVLLCSTPWPYISATVRVHSATSWLRNFDELGCDVISRDDRRTLKVVGPPANINHESSHHVVCIRNPFATLFQDVLDPMLHHRAPRKSNPHPLTTVVTFRHHFVLQYIAFWCSVRFAC